MPHSKLHIFMIHSIVVSLQNYVFMMLNQTFDFHRNEHHLSFMIRITQLGGSAVHQS